MLKNKKGLNKKFHFKNFRSLFLFFLLLCLFLTWKFIRLKKNTPGDTHAIIQKDIENIIFTSIQNNVPYLEDIQVKRVQTKEINKNLIQVHFSYSYKEGSNSEMTTVQIDGKANIERSEKPPSLKEAWVIDDFQIIENQMIFEKGLIIQ